MYVCALPGFVLCNVFTCFEYVQSNAQQNQSTSNIAFDRDHIRTYSDYWAYFSWTRNLFCESVYAIYVSTQSFHHSPPLSTPNICAMFRHKVRHGVCAVTSPHPPLHPSYHCHTQKLACSRFFSIDKPNTKNLYSKLLTAAVQWLNAVLHVCVFLFLADPFSWASALVAVTTVSVCVCLCVFCCISHARNSHLAL